MNRSVEYSPKEVELITRLGRPNWMNIFDSPIILYEQLVMEVFVTNRNGPEVESLRRIMKSISDCKPYRMTPEFDALINFDTSTAEAQGGNGNG